MELQQTSTAPKLHPPRSLVLHRRRTSIPNWPALSVTRSLIQATMAASESVLAFITKANAKGGVVVKGTRNAFYHREAPTQALTQGNKDQPKLDLDLYIQNYTGRTRFERLLFIGKTCVPLCIDALKAAVAEAKKGSDVSRYKEAWDCIRLAAPDEPEARRDEAWIERVEAANKAETARLEAELKGYKNNLIKESIRMGNEDLGQHFETIGKLEAASDYYSRMRQDVSTTKHIIDCGQRLANVSLERKDWPMVLTNIGKMAGLQNSVGDAVDSWDVVAYTKTLSGIALMGLGNYLEAFNSFVMVPGSILAQPSKISHVASPGDIAVYGTLTALATGDREALQRYCLDNPSFRTLYEAEPHLRKAVSHFVNGRYSSCLSILESARVDYLLDIHLHKHVLALFALIRSKCITQYFVPFSCATIASLDAAFGKPGQPIEPELVEMIRAGTLKARVDSKNKVRRHTSVGYDIIDTVQLLVAVRPNARAEMQREALEAAHTYEKAAKERLRRISLASAGLEATPAKRQQHEGLPGLSTDESWFDESRSLAASGAGPVESRG
ncbi:26S proteasome subunit RPN7 [Purpureocillium lavendulum]|uniref:26S proteasome subunit RPN7 n=1 Tax=Purpureocillium lavendulum TaxID=1247861 RepID=A0AB34FS24_9HYPO|nr:26S proteasome subunit RPN7 [Purpureocillium lavendulum]